MIGGEKQATGKGMYMREQILFNDNWLYYAEEQKREAPKKYGTMYLAAKTERMKWGPAAYTHDDSSGDWSTEAEHSAERWLKVNLPHDYIIGQTPVEAENPALGYFQYHNAWYRKHFKIKPEDEGKRITVYFEGITGNSTVYLNGCLMKHNFCGFTSFEVDITDVVRYDRENVLAVYVDTSLYETWWYAGGGIYRNVWLVKTDAVAVDLYGLYVAPVKQNYSSNNNSSNNNTNSWLIPIETTIRNIDYSCHDVKIKSEIIDAKGTVVAVAEGGGEVGARETSEFKCQAELQDPSLWDIDTPVLYQVKTSVHKDNESTACDEYITRFGFRTTEFTPDKGLYLNGRHVKIKGVCSHQDFGLTGKAVPDNIYKHRIHLIREMGANGYRTSHYPHAAATMDALDEMGFLVMDETRHFESAEESMEQFAMLIKRDRNRPSVIMWSTGNEEKTYHAIPQGIKIHRALAALAKKLDPSRPVTSAVAYLDTVVMFDDLEIIGANYGLKFLDDIHARHPDKPVVSSENCAVGTTRGYYYGDNRKRGYFDARDKDKDAVTWHFSREKIWKHIMEREWISGSYQWIAFEHRGEADWPRICSASGAIDLFLQKKDAFYQNLSHWTEEPMVHLLPHWNHRGLEGIPVTVYAYTNCDELELFLNGSSMGRKAIERYGHGEWQVTYTPGKLEVAGYCSGEKKAYDTVETTGAPTALKLILENAPIRANGQDVALITCTCVDGNGREVPDASAFVRFDSNSLGIIVGTGSSDSDHIAVAANDRQMYAGRISVAVKAGRTAGTLMVYAHSDSLQAAFLPIIIE